MVGSWRAGRELAGVGARKTPHRLPVGTPASASPSGEGEEGCAGVASSATVVAGGGRTTGRPLTFILAKTPEFSSPPGEGKERRRLEAIGTAHPRATTALVVPLGESFGCPIVGCAEDPHAEGERGEGRGVRGGARGEGQGRLLP